MWLLEWARSRNASASPPSIITALGEPPPWVSSFQNRELARRAPVGHTRRFPERLRATDIEAAADILPNPDLSWNHWNNTVMLFWAVSDGEAHEAAHVFSKKSKKYDPAATDQRWGEIAKSPPTRMGVGSLIFKVRQFNPNWIPLSQQKKSAAPNPQIGRANNSPNGGEPENSSNDDSESRNQCKHDANDERPRSGESKNSTSSDVDSEICRLAKLSVIEYERERKEAAERLNLRASILDRLVEAERDEFENDAKQGRLLSLPEPEPWPEPVDGAELLRELSAAIRRHVVMFDHAADTAALWAVHTYLLDCFGISPRLAITSPEKGCGKTTALDVLSCLIFRPLPTANASASAIFRVVESHRPTLLIDEADTFLPENEELRGILSSGHRRGGSVIRTVGEDFEPRSFSTYSPCAIALIGRLPATLADRSALIELRRRRADEAIKAFRFDRTDHLHQLARKAARWAADNADRIRDVDPDMPDGVFNRAADNWRPLLAIADIAGGEWPARARRAIQCTGATATGDDQSVRVLLLSDIRAVFAERNADRLSSADLVSALNSIEGRPWAEWNRGRGLSPNGVARQLAPFGIAPGTIRTSTGTPKGYQLAQFDDAFARYLPGDEF